MLHLSQTQYGSSGEFLDNTLDAIEFYGFVPIEHALKARKPARPMKTRGSATVHTHNERKLASLTKTLVAHSVHRADAPACMYHLDSKDSKVASLNLHVSGCTSAIAEGIVLATLANLARESGVERYIVHINSMGDKESAARYIRELTSYLRAHLNNLPSYARDDMQAGNAIRAYSRLVEKQHESVAGAPNPMEYLNDESRGHLHDVLEYIEHMGIPYELDPTVVGSNDCWSHTLFELRTTDEHGNSITFAHGGRHDTLAQKTYRVDMPVVSALIEHEIQGRSKPKRRTLASPRFFFAQLGPRAKMKSFVVLDQLKAAGIPIAQQITLESIGGQLVHAEKNAIPYTVIIGHKEALDDTAIVRNMQTRSQVVVPLSGLPAYLRKLKV